MTGAEPVDASRNDDRSTSASCGRSTSLLHCVGTPWPTVTRSLHHARRASPPTVHGVPVSTRVDDELDLVPELVHVARVRERHRHEPHVVVRAEDVAEPGRRLHGAVVEPRALGQAGRPAGPDDADRVAGVATGPIGELGARGPRRGHSRRAASSPWGWAHRRESRTWRLVQQRHRLTSLEDRRDLAGTEARVDAGRDRAETVHAAYATA